MRSRVLSGMRPTGALHLGHYHGALKNWVRLQDEHDCFFFVADWHALTTHYEERDVMERHVYDMVIDWIAAGLDPEKSTIFIQSRLPEHAELFTLLAMGTPLGWLERVPTYKDQIEKLKDRDLATYGFLGYPLLQAADILIYKPDFRASGRRPGLARRAHARGGTPLQPPVRPQRRTSTTSWSPPRSAKLSKDDARYLEKQRKAFQRKRRRPKRRSNAPKASMRPRRVEQCRAGRTEDSERLHRPPARHRPDHPCPSRR